MRSDQLLPNMWHWAKDEHAGEFIAVAEGVTIPGMRLLITTSADDVTGVLRRRWEATHRPPMHAISQQVSKEPQS